MFINFLNKINFILIKQKYVILLSIFIFNMFFLNKFNYILNSLLSLFVVFINFFIIIKNINNEKIITVSQDIYSEINKIFWPTFYEIIKQAFIITIIIVLFSLILYFCDNIIFYLINSIINI